MAWSKSGTASTHARMCNVKNILALDILPQPNDITCGPTCLQAVYSFYGDIIPLSQVIEEVTSLEAGGTLAVMLGCHALKRGYQAECTTFDLQVFDPTWFASTQVDIRERLHRQMQIKTDPNLHTASQAYLKFLELGGKLSFQDLTPSLLRQHLKKKEPILTGLSATYLYKTARELQVGERLLFDDLKGDPSGHFVVLVGYDAKNRQALIADPLLPNPMSGGQYYHVNLNHLICSIMLGILTFDANLLVITPKPDREHRHVHPHGH